MAKIVAGFASSHTPLMSLPGQDWAKRAEDDKRNRELIRPSDGAHVSYDDLLASADPKIAREIDEEVFVKKFDCIQQSLNELQDTFAQVNPDVVVMFGDDQMMAAFRNSLIVGTATMIVALTLGISSALALRRLNFPGKTVYQFIVLMQPLAGAVFALDGILIGAGDTSYLMWAMIAASAIFITLASVALARDWGIVGVWIALDVLIAARLGLLWIRFVGRRWAVVGWT